VNLKQAISEAREVLSANKDIEEPFLESEVLLRYLLQIDRASFFANIGQELIPQKEVEYKQWIERRLKGEPLAYIIHNREFYNLDFYIDQRVLIPRPETELLVEETLKFAQNHPVSKIADIGTGSGIIAISLAVNLPEVKIYATDVSDSALEIAKINCLKHKVDERVILLQGDLLDPLPELVDVLVANLPYVRKADLAHIPSAKFEPSIALDGGESGLDQLFRFCRQIKPKIRPGGCILLELGMGQGRTVQEYLNSLYPSSKLEILLDLAGIDRVLKIFLNH
jgi:release factor glutamine methyltransferase